MAQAAKGIAILGGSGGLGRASAVHMAGRFPMTIGYHSNPDKAQAVVDQIKTSGGKAQVAQVDMRSGDSVASFFEAAAGQWGGLVGIVSVTGPAVPLGPVADVKDEDFKRIYETDVFGSFNVLRHGSKALARHGGGAMVLFVTAAILRTLDNDGMSAGPKMAVEGLMRQVAREAGPNNVRVNGVAPGVIDAGIVHTLDVDPVAKAVFEKAVNETPLQRMGKPEEIAALVDFLMSPGAAYISGQIIGIDGGYSA